MAFGTQKDTDCIVGNVGGCIVTSNFSYNDRVLFLLMGAALGEIQCFEFSVAHTIALIIAPRSKKSIIDSDRFTSILNQRFDETLGKLIRLLRI